MKLKEILLLAVVPLLLMVYGWYLGQLHQSGYDVAGIFLFFTGITGFMLALIIRLITQRYSWHDRWYINLLLGAAGCAITYLGVLIFARVYG
jgi:hypothetical protein